MRVCMYACMHACVYVMYVCDVMYVCMFVMYVCMHVCMYVGMYVCVRRNFGPSLCLVKRLSGTRLAAHGDAVYANVMRPLAANKVRRRRESLSGWLSWRDRTTRRRRRYLRSIRTTSSNQVPDPGHRVTIIPGKPCLLEQEAGQSGSQGRTL